MRHQNAAAQKRKPKGQMTITLEEYRQLTDAQLRQLNDDQYGMVGGWDIGADAGTADNDGRIASGYRPGRSLARDPSADRPSRNA